MLTLLLMSTLTLAFNILLVKASGTIYIRADGSIDPPTAPISTVDNVTYTLTGNITSDADGIAVERSNIIIDGNASILQGSGSGYGFCLCSIDNVTIKNTNIRSFYNGIWLDYSSSGNSISGNNITANNGNGIWIASSSNNNNIRNNTIINNWYGIFIIEFSSYNSISGNNITANDYTGIWLELKSSYNTIVGNNIMGNGGFGIGLFDSSYNSISGNQIKANSYDGINVSTSSDNTIIRNNITENNNPGISLHSLSSYNSISGNNITENSVFGIWLSSSSDNNSVRGNNIANNGLVGIGVFSSSYNSIFGNSITKKHYSGIWLSDTLSAGNTIFGNDIALGFYGFYIYASSNNVIYHNNFINNTIQAYIEISDFDNTWDDGYASGGNYWSDYTSVDLFSGPYQNLTGSDGIGDTPYIIDPSNQDNYPLMNPWTGTSIVNIPIPSGGTAVVEGNVTITKAIVTKNALHFDASGPSGSTGWVNVTFPMINTTEIKVFINKVKLTPPPFPIITSNGTHYFIYFEFTLSTHEIEIVFAPLLLMKGPYYTWWGAEYWIVEIGKHPIRLVSNY